MNFNTDDLRKGPIIIEKKQKVFKKIWQIT